jgi:hypothetical protein
VCVVVCERVCVARMPPAAAVVSGGALDQDGGLRARQPPSGRSAELLGAE